MYMKNYLAAAEVADKILSGEYEQERKESSGIMSRVSDKVVVDMDAKDTFSQRDVADYLANMRKRIAEESPAVEGGSVTGMATPEPEELPEGTTRPVSRSNTPIASDSSDRELLAKTLHAEAAGEGYIGMLAAGAVISNRVKKGGFGKGLRGVILKPGQFSAWNLATGYAKGEGGLNMDKMKPSEEAYAAADAILSGDYESPVGDSTHYYNPEVVEPKWGQKYGGKWTKIGNHVFGFAN